LARLPIISSNLPDLVDNYITTRAQRLVMQKQVDEIEELEKELNKTIIAKLREGGMTAMGGKVGLVKMHEAIEPIAEDWPATWAYMKEHDAFELVHKRLTVTAVKERWEHGEEVPGVGRVPKFSLSVSKS